MPNIYIAISVRAFACAKRTFEWNVYIQTGNTYDNVTRIFSRQFARGVFATRSERRKKKGNGGEERNYSRINYARGNVNVSPVFACVLPSSLFVLPSSVRTAWIVWRGKEVNLLGNRRIDSLDTEEKVNYAALCRTIYESLVSPSKGSNLCNDKSVVRSS